MTLSELTKHLYRTAQKHGNILSPIFLCIIVGAFWSILWIHNIKVKPVYIGELKAISLADWKTMWTWTDYEAYYRYSPTGLLAIGMIDRYVLSPWLGIAFSTQPTSQFAVALRLVPIIILGFVLLALLVYLLCRALSLGVRAAFIAGLFFGVNKAFAYYFYFVSTLALVLLAIYAIGLLFFWTRYLKNRREVYLIGYYACLLLAVGAWEQWMNLLPFLLLFSILLMSHNKKLDRGILVHGMIVPMLIFLVYMFFRYPTLLLESSSVAEAQSVFSYPSVSLMIEDILSNASLLIAATFDSLLFPWPMLSQSVIYGYNMDTYNAYDKLYTQYSTLHYRAFTDWYAGLLFAFFLCFTLALINYLRKKPPQRSVPAMSLVLVYSGYAIYLPLMYRAYFILPGVAGLLGYKSSLSILGASILIGWIIDRMLKSESKRISPRMASYIVLVLCGWILLNNCVKIAISFSFPWGTFPW